MGGTILFAYNLSESDNQFVQIHIRMLEELGYEVTASLDEFWHPTKSYNILVINWPDYFFGWNINISDEEVTELNKSLNRWKQSKTKIFTFLHDEYSHFGRGANLNLLFDLCYSKSDILIHLGDYSKKKYSDLYPDAQHHIIHHPLYTDFQTDLERNVARKQLGISEKVHLVFVPGGIRKTEEIDYCIRVFRKLPAKNKRMIFQKTNFLAKPQSLKNFIDLKVWVYFLLHTCKFNFLENIFFLQGFMKKEKLSAYFAASDLIIIPRTDILNSGNIILAAQFGKRIIGTGRGNMNELLTFLEQPVCSSEAMAALINPIQYSALVGKSLQLKIEEFSGHGMVKNQWKQLLHL